MLQLDDNLHLQVISFSKFMHQWAHARVIRGWANGECSHSDYYYRGGGGGYRERDYYHRGYRHRSPSPHYRRRRYERERSYSPRKSYYHPER